jgi:plasmid stabilization system protein ParE
MTLPVVVPGHVEKEISGIDAWWREHRLASPSLFAEELAAAFELLASAPHAGRRYDHPSLSGVRRVILRATRYHVYYKARSHDVVVLAVWSALRGTAPKLK